MTLGLAGEERTLLERFVQRTRSWIEDDLASTLEGRFGIRVDGVIEDVGSVSLTNAQLAVRSDLVDIVEFLRAEGEDIAGSVDRLVREAAFTHTNRLIAVRVAEAIGVLPETMARGVASSGFKDFSELAPIIADTDWGRFAVFVRLCADELASDVPALFDLRNPLLELEVSEAVLASVVQAMQDLPAGIWGAPDALGWAYQFFNTNEDRKNARYRADGSPKPPESSEDLAVRNQFFTPSYVVDFLVQNGLGSYLSAGFPELADELPLLVEVPEYRIDLDLNQVSVLDPACGSGHFLLGAYDLLEQAWQCAGVKPAQSAPTIIRSLWGIDIDPRATQIAQAAVMFRARRHCRTTPLPKPNIICARALPAGPEIDALSDALPEHVGRAVRGIASELADAPVLGPLLKIEERLNLEVRDILGTGVIEGTLADADNEATRRLEAQVFVALNAIADSTTSSTTQRLFAAEAHDAIRFIEAMSRRYTTVVMNPPFGLCTPGTQPYLRAGYSGWTDLFGCFVERARMLASPHGTVGVLMPNTVFNTRKMKGLRRALLEASSIRYVADLGDGVLEDAAVEVAAVTLARSDSISYLDLVDVPPNLKGQALRSFATDAQTSCSADYLDDDRCLLTFRRTMTEAADIKLLDPTYALVRTGGNTFDNFRFVRMWWEVGSGRHERGWKDYFKGGDYFPYASATRLIVDWKDDGENLRALGKERGVLPQVMQSSRYWGEPGLTYPRAGKQFGARRMPAGGIFAEKSVAILPTAGDDSEMLLGLLNSSPVSAFFSEIGRGRFVENSWVKSVPLDVAHLEENRHQISSLTDVMIQVYSSIDMFDETSPEYEGFPSALAVFDEVEEAVAVAIEAQQQLDKLSADIVGREPEAGHAIHVSEPLRFLGSNDELAFRQVSFAVGQCFGRWTEAPQPSLYVQDPGNPLDLSTAVQERLDLDSFNEDLTELDAQSFFGSGGVEGFVRNRFFRRHLKMYSQSRRKAPVYWQLQVPSKHWGLWLYAPKLSRELLFSIVTETERRQRIAESQIAHLTQEAETGNGGRSASALAKSLDVEQTLAVELESFRAEADRIANLGWEPDLDDGMVLNAAPLADLFPAWKETSKYREELRAGKYEWATVAQYADQL